MKSVELFAGAGGLALGAAQAGFDHEVVLEWNRNACETLRRNRDARVANVSDWNIEECDARDYDFSQHSSRVEFVAGGPPCQPFSLGGKHQGKDDSRNMFPQAVRAVREIAPKAFVFENVKGLLRKNFASYYSYIIHQLTYPELLSRANEDWSSHLRRLEQVAARRSYSGLHYDVVFQLLDAANYGVPQRRHRVFIVGIRSDLTFDFSFPDPTHSEAALLYDQWVSGEYWDRHEIPRGKRPHLGTRLKQRVDRLRDCMPDMIGKPWKTVRDAIFDLPRLSEGQTCASTPNHFLNPGAKSYAGHNGSPYDMPAKALKAGDHGVPGGENTLRFADNSVRYFSVRECARIQTFPDDWVFEGSWTESMRQLGNAVPVALARAVSEKLADSMINKKSRKKLKPARGLQLTS